jgi:hypothetical protein
MPTVPRTVVDWLNEAGREDRTRWAELRSRLLEDLILWDHRPDWLNAWEAAQSWTRFREWQIKEMTRDITAAWENEASTRDWAEGELLASRLILRVLLEDRFGALPADLLQQIDSLTDIPRLRKAAVWGPRMGKLEHLKI